jgi:hypothetical protein
MVRPGDTAKHTKPVGVVQPGSGDGTGATQLHPSGDMPVLRTAWYPKTQATFSDVLAEVRRELWGKFDYATSTQDPDVLLVPRSDMDRLAYALCY